MAISPEVALCINFLLALSVILRKCLRDNSSLEKKFSEIKYHHSKPLPSK